MYWYICIKLTRYWRTFECYPYPNLGAWCLTLPFNISMTCLSSFPLWGVCYVHECWLGLFSSSTIPKCGLYTVANANQLLSLTMKWRSGTATGRKQAHVHWMLVAGISPQENVGNGIQILVWKWNVDTKLQHLLQGKPKQGEESDVFVSFLLHFMARE